MGRSIFSSLSNLELNKENAELLFTHMLDSQGFTRVPLSASATYRIVRQRDARDMAIPIVEADSQRAPQLPDHWDIMTLKYKAVHPKRVEGMARMLRSFMPAASRIIPEGGSGMVFVTDTAPNLKKAYDLMLVSDSSRDSGKLHKK